MHCSELLIAHKMTQRIPAKLSQKWIFGLENKQETEKVKKSGWGVDLRIGSRGCPMGVVALDTRCLQLCERVSLS